MCQNNIDTSVIFEMPRELLSTQNYYWLKRYESLFSWFDFYIFYIATNLLKCTP